MKVHRPLLEGIERSLQSIIFDGLHLDKVLEITFKSHKKWGARDRRLVAEAIYDVVRWHRRMEWAFGQPATARDLTYAWLALNDFETDPAWPVDEFLAKWEEDAPTRALEQSIPDWLDAKGFRELGDKWESTLTVLNEKAPTFLRTNTLKTTRSELRQGLVEENIETETVGDYDAVRLVKRANVFQTKAYKYGMFEMQDLSSQLVAPFMKLQPGMRVIDACAGAGGKSLHAAALMKNKGKIIALDIHDWKLEELKKRAARGGVDIIETRLIENSKTIKRLADSADRVLLDVPCTGSGVLRRKPDTKWKLTAEDCGKLNELQFEILRDYSSMVKPGGTLIYATCSLFPSENQEIVKKFVTIQENQWTLDEQHSVLPRSEEGDGFYMARLVRNIVSK